MGQKINKLYCQTLGGLLNSWSARISKARKPEIRDFEIRGCEIQAFEIRSFKIQANDYVIMKYGLMYRIHPEYLTHAVTWVYFSFFIKHIGYVVTYTTAQIHKLAIELTVRKMGQTHISNRLFSSFVHICYIVLHAGVPFAIYLYYLFGISVVNFIANMSKYLSCVNI